jgi:hypothetical protein
MKTRNLLMGVAIWGAVGFASVTLVSHNSYAQLADPAITDTTITGFPTADVPTDAAALVDDALAVDGSADDNALIPLSGGKAGKKPPPHFDFTTPPDTITLVNGPFSCGKPNLVDCKANGTHLDCTTGNGSHKITINGLSDVKKGKILLSVYCATHP